MLKQKRRSVKRVRELDMNSFTQKKATVVERCAVVDVIKINTARQESDHKEMKIQKNRRVAVLDRWSMAVGSVAVSMVTHPWAAWWLISALVSTYISFIYLISSLLSHWSVHSVFPGSNKNRVPLPISVWRPHLLFPTLASHYLSFRNVRHGPLHILNN